MSGRDGPPALGRPRRPEWRVAAAFGLTSVAAIGFGVVYALGGHSRAEGVLLGLAMAGLAYGFIVWGRELMPQGPWVEEHDPPRSEPDQLRAFHARLEWGTRAIGRRRLLGRMAALALGSLGIAALVPLRSLAPRRDPIELLTTTRWQPGVALVTDDGRRLQAEELTAGTVVKVFPEGDLESRDAAALLLRVEPGRLQATADTADAAARGLVAYSILCTHAGCPVGLYERTTHRLFCPCHQSAFDVLDEARPVAGPAAKPLPRLPLQVGTDGYLRAAGDFSAPVGPAFWRRDP